MTAGPRRWLRPRVVMLHAGGLGGDVGPVVRIRVAVGVFLDQPHLVVGHPNHGWP